MEYALEKNQNHEIDDTKRIHAADALYKKDGGEYYCEVCHQRLYKSTSSKGNPYFYHDGSAEMYCTKETWTLEETTSWHKRIQCAIKSLIPNIQLEKYLRRNDEVHRADAYLASDSQNMVIEVQSSHIDIEDVQKRNAFYTINGKCLWILNTAKHFASGEISVTWSAQQQPVIETTSTLIHNVVHGRNTANVSICLQKNENAFVFIQAAYKNYCIDGPYGYRVSQTYTWDELVEMITQDSLPQYSLSFEEQNFISIPRKIKQQMSAYTAKRYYPQYDDARKAKTAQQLLKVLQTYPVDDTLCSIAMNHHCLAGEQHHADYETVVMYLIENKLTFPVAETLLAYIDENDHAEIFNTLMQKVQQRSDWHSQAGLVQYYCAQKTTDDEVLEQLSKSTNEQVRIAVALNQNTALQTLVHLSQDKSPDVVETAFCNMNIELCAETLSDYYIMLEEYRDIDTKLSVARRQVSEVQQLLSKERVKTIQLSDENGVLRKENQELKRRNETLSAYYQMQKDSIDALQREVVKLQGAAMVNIYQMTPTQQCNEIVMPFIDLVSTLRQNHANGEFLFFVENGPHNWGKEVQCIHVSETAVTPLWYLSYAFSDKTRCNYKYTLKDHMPNSTKCRLITENEAMKIFGEKYYRSPIYTPRR